MYHDRSWNGADLRSYDLDEWSVFWRNEIARRRSHERYWAYLRFFELHVSRVALMPISLG